MNALRKAMLSIFLAAGALAWAQAPDFLNILNTVDERSNFARDDFAAKVVMITEDPEKGNSSKSIQLFRRDKDQKSVMLILAPEAELGQGYLLIEDNLWFYDPDSRKFSHSSMKENFMASDAKNSDFATSSLAVDYRISSHADGKIGAMEVWIIELEAKNNEVSYAYKKIYVTKKDSLLLKSEDFSLAKRLLRTAYYTSYAKIGSSFVADKILFVDALAKGKKTQVALSGISTALIPDSVFTKSYVERVNH